MSTIQTLPGNFISISIIPLLAPDEPNTLGNRLHILRKIYCILHKVYSKFTLHSMRRTDKWFFRPFSWVGSFINHELLSVIIQYRGSWWKQIRISKIRLLHFSTHSCFLLLVYSFFHPHNYILSIIKSSFFSTSTYHSFFFFFTVHLFVYSSILTLFHSFLLFPVRKNKVIR